MWMLLPKVRPESGHLYILNGSGFALIVLHFDLEMMSILILRSTMTWSVRHECSMCEREDIGDRCPEPATRRDSQRGLHVHADNRHQSCLSSAMKHMQLIPAVVGEDEELPRPCQRRRFDHMIVNIQKSATASAELSRSFKVEHPRWISLLHD